MDRKDGREITMFNEKKTENYKGKDLPVWQTPKYEQSKAKALEIIKTYERVEEGDFWILMNTYANGTKMMYSGLIISHNGCLKINDAQEKVKKFVPSCVSLDKDGYKGSLVYSYMNDEQGIYEVGEVSPTNCKNDYPYAMAYKRLFDRVVLKLCGLAYDGVYSDSEADEFKQQYDDGSQQEEQKAREDMQKKISKRELADVMGLMEQYKISEEEMFKAYGIKQLQDMTKANFGNFIQYTMSLSKNSKTIGVK